MIAGELALRIKDAEQHAGVGSSMTAEMPIIMKKMVDDNAQRAEAAALETSDEGSGAKTSGDT